MLGSSRQRAKGLPAGWRRSDLAHRGSGLRREGEEGRGAGTGTSHPLPASAIRDRSPTWGSWGSGVTFLSLLSWELVETCGERHRCHLRAAALREGGGFPPALPCLAEVPQTAPRGLGEGHPLTRERRVAGVTEGLWRCKGSGCRDCSILGDPPPHAGDSPTCQPQPGCHQSILSALQAGGDTGGAVPACPAW